MPGSPLPPELRAWFDRRTFLASPAPAEAAAAKRSAGVTVSVCLPALDEEETIRSICSTINAELVGGCGLVDELLVVDSGSTDETRAEAESGGATVVAAADVLRGIVPPPEVPGKGEVLWKSLAVARGDVVVWLDSDTRNFDSHFVTNLVAPLLADPSVLLCKGFYTRPLDQASGGGGRVTELAARPLLNLLFPELAGLVQPLSGEYAGRREALASLPLFTGYAVEAGILIDLVTRFGLDTLAQADLGTRVHRNRDVTFLGRMASEIAQAILAAAEDHGRLKSPDVLPDLLVQFDQSGAAPEPSATRVRLQRRPPMETVVGGRA
ncbi:MAG TPA: glucosyl-3-phosphoglycerate synthase [Actinomycetota bacterium]|nr:glucosyl-3-phosphoglycerate synthase [Actinomycetota bacterium]